MPTSSVYFAETSGELSVMRGVRAFQQAESVEVADLAPRIDRSKWTFVPLTLREHILENTFYVHSVYTQRTRSREHILCTDTMNAPRFTVLLSPLWRGYSWM